MNAEETLRYIEKVLRERTKLTKSERSIAKAGALFSAWKKEATCPHLPDGAYSEMVRTIGTPDDDTLRDAFTLLRSETAADGTPESVIDICSALLTEGQERTDIIEVGSGCGTLALSLRANGIWDKVGYTGLEIDTFRALWSSAVLEMEGLGRDLIINDDAFRFAVAYPERKYPRVFSNYSLGMKLNQKRAVKELSGRIGIGPQKDMSSDWAFNTLLCSLMTDDGKAVGIMTQGAACNRSDRGIRREFTERGLIEMVIDLPERVFRETAVRTSIIVFSHGNGSVKLIDARTMGRKGLRSMEPDPALILEAVRKVRSGVTDDTVKSVTYEELADADFILSRERYRSGEGLVPMSEIISSVTRGTGMKEKDIAELYSQEETESRLLLPSDLMEGGIDWSGLHSLREIPSSEMKYTAGKGDLIITRTVSPFRAVIADIPEGGRLLVSGNLYIVRLDREKAEDGFIRLWLESGEGQKEVRRVATGTGVKMLSRAALDEIGVPAWTRGEQAERIRVIEEKEREMESLRNELAELTREKEILITELPGNSR